MTIQQTYPTDTTEAIAVPTRRRPGALAAVLRSVEGIIGLACGALVLCIIVIGPVIAPFAPDEIGVGAPVEPPSAIHLLGTDDLGRDVLSRFLTGGADLLVIPLAAVAIAAVLGTLLGMLGGYFGGKVDLVVRVMFDLLLAFPPLLLVLVVVANLGRSALVLAAVISLTFLPRIGRVVRGATQVARSQDYSDAAIARGESWSAVLSREILPNVLGPTIADVSLRVTYAIIFVATLSFLGLGAQPPSSNWGLMIAESRDLLASSPQVMLAPAVGIALLSVSFNLIADALTRHLAAIGGSAGSSRWSALDV